ncbi:MAG: hypothetical protein M3546_01790 [Actinomycetota bacterium]|nr:hypothetical protein [Actinomycetota bacterium]
MLLVSARVVATRRDSAKVVARVVAPSPTKVPDLTNAPEWEKAYWARKLEGDVA